MAGKLDGLSLPRFVITNSAYVRACRKTCLWYISDWLKVNQKLL